MDSETDRVLGRVRAAQAAQRAHQAEQDRLADRTAAAVADLVAACGTQERAAELLGITQGRVAALVKRARALAETRP